MILKAGMRPFQKNRPQQNGRTGRSQTMKNKPAGNKTGIILIKQSIVKVLLMQV